MEQMRFVDYLSVSIDIEPEAEDRTIPALLLQPLVENAIKQGSRTSPDTLEVSIDVKILSPDDLRLVLTNTGTWVEPGTTDSNKSTGTGLENLQQRLEKYYPDTHRFTAEDTGGQVRIEITVPLSVAPSST